MSDKPSLQGWLRQQLVQAVVLLVVLALLPTVLLLLMPLFRIAVLVLAIGFAVWLFIYVLTYRRQRW